MNGRVTFDRQTLSFVVRATRPSDGKLTYVCRTKTKREAEEALAWWKHEESSSDAETQEP